MRDGPPRVQAGTVFVCLEQNGSVACKRALGMRTNHLR